MESLAAWALAGLLPAYAGADGANMARSLRRRFAVLGVLLGLTLVGTLWEWTANIAMTGGAAVLMGIALWLYSEHGDRPAAWSVRAEDLCQKRRRIGILGATT